ncbi:hypothetical protein EMIHUDRAFT_229007 [Emiliania huxleyi CCMP1516]|uniref:Uncharacterized protein n=2 Tax=Emiliania huxleyi TaxID=2903 RepID=A0A0D3KDU1_EMIH1|nr:hypothetical protein EMIHUDRAFT_229007 [Emiliania huxleyi CCMP1516]EOD33926.1 hypothetical protein EMIHUDRAFT_229007 [Emiliania huxleyi CCMP1516]|eukprot:XP_005786355.1 hypothetical protein EMIHUDRAFT_229007 [Emiliania huxleyi CCMP1516]
MGCTSSCQATVTDAVDDALPTVGVLRCHKARWEPAQAMVGRDTNSYLFRTVHAEVDGLPYVDLRARNELTPSQLKALNEAVKALDAQGVIAITGDCGAFVHCQKEVRKLTKTPVLVITNDSSDYTQTDLEQNLIEIGLSPDDAARFIIQAIFGLQHIPGFSTSEIADEGVDKWSIVDNNEELRSKIVRTVEDAKAANPNLRAILLESTLLPSFSDSLRQKRGVPVFDAITLADYYAAASTDNPRFGQTFGGGRANNPMEGLSKKAIPAIGSTPHIDSHKTAHAQDVLMRGCSYNFRTVQEVAKGLTFEVAQEGSPLTTEQRTEMEAAIRRLEASEGVVGITGDCGFLMNYQVDARRMSHLPCFISAEFLVLTANGKSLAPKFREMLSLAHVTSPDDQARFHILGCEDVDGFDAVAKGEAVDVQRVTPGILPPYADALRHALRMPVLDAITLVDYFHSAMTDNPAFGVDFQKSSREPVSASA